MRVITVFVGLLLGTLALADDHAPVPLGEGAFTTLMVQSDDIGAYIDAVKANTGPLEATGAGAAGSCITKSGNEYAGQMMIWSGFNSVAEALSSMEKYDPFNAPAAFESLRTVKYSVTWKPLKPFKLDPGFERVMRMEVDGENQTNFVALIAKLEAAVRAEGYDINIGVFQPIGGGAHEASTLMVRAITQDGTTHGKIIDEAFAGASWMPMWLSALELVDEMTTDTFEICDQFYTAG